MKSASASAVDDANADLEALWIDLAGAYGELVEALAPATKRRPTLPIEVEQQIRDLAHRIESLMELIEQEIENSELDAGEMQAQNEQVFAEVTALVMHARELRGRVNDLSR